jgi:spermidine synthase
LTRDANDVLYDLQGLRAARMALRPGGVLAVWAARPDLKFTQRLRQADFDVDEIKVRANKARAGAKHTIWIATRDSRDMTRSDNESK